MANKTQAKTGGKARTKASVERSIRGKIKRTPDAPRRDRYAPKVEGKTSGLGIMLFWATLFELNEKLPKQKKMTDEEIKRQVLEEFPIDEVREVTRKALSKLGAVGEKGEKTVNYYRGLYNIGRCTKGIVPTVKSYRYGEDGEQVNARTGKPLKDKGGA